MRSYRSKAIAFGLVALVGASSASLADASEGAGSAVAPKPGPEAASTRLGRHAAEVAGTAGSRSLGTGLHLGEPLHAASQLLGRLSLNPQTLRFTAAARPGSLSLAPPAFTPDRSASEASSGGVTGGGAMLQPTLARVVALLSAGAALPSTPTGQGEGSPAPSTVPAVRPIPTIPAVPVIPVVPAAAEQVTPQPDEQAPPEEAAAPAEPAEEVAQGVAENAAPVSPAAPPSGDRPYVPGAPSAAQLEQLRWCESGGNYTAISYGGWYRGAYQFDFRTWDSVASRWMPHLVGTDPAAADPADQDLLASALYSERGRQPWPHCGLGV